MSAIRVDWRRFGTVLPGFTTTTGLTLISGLDSLFTFPYGVTVHLGSGSAGAELGLHWVTRGLGFAVLVW